MLYIQARRHYPDTQTTQTTQTQTHDTHHSHTIQEGTGPNPKPTRGTNKLTGCSCSNCNCNQQQLYWRLTRPTGTFTCMPYAMKTNKQKQENKGQGNAYTNHKRDDMASKKCDGDNSELILNITYFNQSHILFISAVSCEADLCHVSSLSMFVYIEGR